MVSNPVNVTSVACLLFALLTLMCCKTAAVVCIWYPLLDLFRFQTPNVIKAAHAHRVSNILHNLSVILHSHFMNGTLFSSSADVCGGFTVRSVSWRMFWSHFKVYRHFHSGSAMKCRATKSVSSSFSLLLIRSMGFWQGFWGISSVLEASLWSCVISSVRDKCSWKLL